MCVLVLDAALGLRELVLDSGLVWVTLILDSRVVWEFCSPIAG